MPARVPTETARASAGLDKAEIDKEGKKGKLPWLWIKCVSVSNCSLWSDVGTFRSESFNPQHFTNLRHAFLSARHRLFSGSSFSICLLQVVSADLCNLWHAAGSAALQNMHCARLHAEVTGCDNFCLADNHRRNHAKPPFPASQ